MSDRLFYGLSAAAAVVMIALALVWPQGLGARSPGPFGQVTTAERARAAAQKQGFRPADAEKARAKLKGAL